MKRRAAAVLAGILAATMAVPTMAEGVTFTFFNSKMEIQTQLEDVTSTYGEASGDTLEVYYSNDPVITHMGTKYASNEPYTISMVDAKDIYSLTPEHGMDLSGVDAAKDTSLAITIDDKVAGLPFCVEARGVIYNKDAIEAITGEEFDPTAYATLDDFKALLDKLVEGGMEYPVGIMKEDWSLGAHYLAQVVEEQDDPQAFVDALKAGEADLANNEKFNALMDTFDVLKAYNYAQDAPNAAEREVTEAYLASGEIAFMFGGNWDWSVLVEYDAPDTMGMMPVPQNTEDGSNTKLVGGGSKYLFIDSSVSEEEQQAAVDFINWLVYDEAGQDFLVNTCALVPPYSNITLDVADPLGASVKSFSDAAALIDNYNYFPDDHYPKVGASMQKYLADEIDRAGLVAELEEYWAAVE